MAARGTHDELLQTSPLYAEIYQQQLKPGSCDDLPQLPRVGTPMSFTIGLPRPAWARAAPWKTSAAAGQSNERAVFNRRMSSAACWPTCARIRRRMAMAFVLMLVDIRADPAHPLPDQNRHR